MSYAYMLDEQSVQAQGLVERHVGLLLPRAAGRNKGINGTLFPANGTAIRVAEPEWSRKRGDKARRAGIEPVVYAASGDTKLHHQMLHPDNPRRSIGKCELPGINKLYRVMLRRLIDAGPIEKGGRKQLGRRREDRRSRRGTGVHVMPFVLKWRQDLASFQYSGRLPEPLER